MNWKVGYFMKANEGIYGVIRQALPEGCELVTLAGGGDPLALAADLDVLIAGKVSAAIIHAAPRLKLILTPGIGSDGVDLEAAQRRGIPVAVTVCGNTDEVAEHTLMLMLAVARRLSELDAALREGRWLMWDRRLQSVNLKGKVLGIIGLGRIGRAVAARAVAFGMNIRYADTVEVPGFERLSVDDLLDTSDFVSLHVPLTPGTRSLLDRQRIARMKPGAILINTSRGEVVDEEALIEALQSGHLAGAGLDVFAKEPPEKSNPLLAMPNVVITPHSGAGTRDGLDVKAAQYAENIRRAFAGEPLIDCIWAPEQVEAR